MKLPKINTWNFEHILRWIYHDPVPDMGLDHLLGLGSKLGHFWQRTSDSNN